MLTQGTPFAPCREVKPSVYGDQKRRVGKSLPPCRENVRPYWGDWSSLAGRCYLVGRSLRDRRIKEPA